MTAAVPTKATSAIGNAMQRVLCVILMAGLLMMLAPTLRAEDPAAPGADLILILDASNSMWGQIDGQNKIVIAREAVGVLIDSLPDDSNVGLIAYGHRRQGDCQDIQTLQTVAPIDKSSLKSTINSINPKGRTPITSSINEAIDLARGREHSSIVLISDGLETCDLDPCAAVRTARREGVPFILHVIGFDVAGEDTSQLECAAQAGDGQFFSAEDARGLSAALMSAYDKPAIPDGRLVVKATAEGKLHDAVVEVFVTDTGELAASGRTYDDAATNPRSIPLEDGRYRARIAAIGIKGSPSHEIEFEISDGSRIEREFDYSSGALAITVTRNGELSDATLRILSRADGSEVAAGRTYTSPDTNPRAMPIAAGSYDVEIKSIELRNGNVHLIEDVGVDGGAQTDLSHDFASGTLVIGTHRSGALVDAVIAVLEAPGTNIGGGRTYTRPASNPKSFIVKPGSYRIRVNEIRGERREFDLAVAAGGTAELSIDLDQP